MRRYFGSRIGKPMAWSFTTGESGYGKVYRRDYAITVTGVDSAGNLVATVTSHDIGPTGQRTTRVPNQHGVAKVPLKGVATPLEALEDVARAVDAALLDRFPRQTEKGGAAGAGTGNLVEDRLRALDTKEGRGADEAPPRPESVARFRKFWGENPGLFVPDLFSSKDGTLRARWQDGHDRTLWINFPDAGPLGWSATVPRQGSYGLRRLNARCNEDQDIIPLATLLGVKCHRPT